MAGVVAGGYSGRALVVDVGAATGEPLPLDDAVLRAYLGGVGLGTWLLHALSPDRVDPLDPAAPLAFVFSPLVGTPLTTSARPEYPPATTPATVGASGAGECAGVGQALCAFTGGAAATRPRRRTGTPPRRPWRAAAPGRG